MKRIAMIPMLLGVLSLFPSTASAGALDASRNAPFDRERAAHLLRRAGFGGSPAEIDALAAVGRDAAVDRLVDIEKIRPNVEPYPAAGSYRPPARQAFRDLDEDERKAVSDYLRDLQAAHMQAVREWWLWRMIVTKRPLEEKMTLFWHGYFTSGFREVRDWKLLHDQNELFRRNALGSFRTLLLGICKDGAMLRYLDNDKNSKDRPNENFARELLELFTMGEGNYTEADVRAAARALTGWRVEADGVLLRPRLHDTRRKTFLGRTGNFDATDVVDIILAKPATARYLAKKLWEFFAYPDPEAAIVEALAAELRRIKFDLRSAVRAILRSDAFYSPRALHSKIKSPVDLVVSTHRALEIEPGDLRRTSQLCRQMGQDLFQPPNVKGWDGGRTWITTSTLFARQNFGRHVLTAFGRQPRRPAMRAGAKKGKPAEAMPAGGGEMPDARGRVRRGERDRRAELLERLRGEKKAAIREAIERLPEPQAISSPRPPYDPMPVVEKLKPPSARAVVEHYASRLLQTTLSEERATTLEAALSPAGKSFDPGKGDAVARVRDLVQLIMSMPEYQLQ